MDIDQEIGGRRRWTTAEKRMLVETAAEPGSSVAEVADCFGVAASQIYAWRKQMQDGELDDGNGASFARVELGAARPILRVPSSVVEPGKIVIAFGCGTRVRIDGAADPVTLGVVLDRLAS